MVYLGSRLGGGEVGTLEGLLEALEEERLPPCLLGGRGGM